MLLWATVATSLSQAMTRSRWKKKIVTSFFRSLLFFWQHSENWVFLKTVSFHLQSCKWAFTLQWCKTLAWKISHTCSLGAIDLVRVEMASDWFTRIYRSIFAEQNFLQDRDMACKLGCGLFLSPQLLNLLSHGVSLPITIQTFKSPLRTEVFWFKLFRCPNYFITGIHYLAVLVCTSLESIPTCIQ